MENELVSINITTYNRANLLPRCLDSILLQSYKRLEINIVDDCSTDDTKTIVEHYQNKDPRIKYYRHDINKGNACARNTALKHCTGYYVAFMDDDDEWIDEDKIKKQVEIFVDKKNTNIGIVCSSVRLYKNEKDYINKIINEPKNINKHILRGNGIIYSPTVMTKKNILLQVDGFDVRLPRGVDSDFYRKCILKYNYKIFFMPDITTAIHEYGCDRMTLQHSFKSLNRSLRTHFITLNSYFIYYVRYPSSLYVRLKSVAVVLILYIKNILFSKNIQN